MGLVPRDDDAPVAVRPAGWKRVCGARRLRALLIVIAAAHVLAGCQAREPERTAGPELNRHEFANLAEALASPEYAAARRDPVVFIGLDGASWDFIDPLITEGELPNLARLKQTGAHARLRSVYCSVSPPAWVSMFCGYEPHRTGVYTFGRWDESVGDFVSVNSLDAATPSVWDVASVSGRRVAVGNIPVTYPVRAVNGIMVSGLMTPIESGDQLRMTESTADYAGAIQINRSLATYSIPIRRAMDDSLNSIRWSLYDSVDDEKENFDLVSATVFAKTPQGQQERGTVVFKLGDFSPWVLVQTMRDGKVTDAWTKFSIDTSTGGFRIGTTPTFFPIEGPYTYPDSLDAILRREFGFYLPSKFVAENMVRETARDAASYASFLYDYDDWDLFSFVFTQSDNIHHITGFDHTATRVYRVIDGFLGELMERLPTGATLIIASDHGFKRYRYSIDLNRYLAAKGLLEMDEEGKVDVRRSLVVHNLWHLYFNESLLTADELEKRGITASGLEPREALTRHLEALAQGFAEDTIAEVPLEFTRMPEDGVGDVPDMAVQPYYGHYQVVFWNLLKPQASAVSRVPIEAAWHHTREGIFLAWGDAIRDGVDLGTRDITDVAPTILYLQGLLTAEDMNGSIVVDAIEPSYLAESPAYTLPDFTEIEKGAVAGFADQESLEKKLRALGYIR